MAATDQDVQNVKDQSPTSQSQDAMSATTQVMQTTELLEKIIAGLPMNKIYASQRVSKHWLAVIQESRTIQKQMFRVSKGEPVAPSRIRSSNFDGRNIRTKAVYRKELDCNPGSKSFFPISASLIEYDPVVVIYRMKFHWAEEGIRQTVNDTFLTQPPCTTALLQVGLHGPTSKMSSNYDLDCSVRDPNGLTVGLIGEVAQKMWRNVCGPKAEDRVYVHVVFHMPLSERQSNAWEENVRRFRDFTTFETESLGIQL